MNIINIRRVLNAIESIILYLDKTEVYVAKYIANVIYIVSINIKSLHETPIISWTCTEHNFKNMGTRVYNGNLFIVYQENDNLIIKRISLSKKNIEIEKSYPIKGNKLDYQRILVISENSIIVFFEELKFFSYDGFLCELCEDTSHYINDRCLVDSIIKNFNLYKIGNKDYICFEEIYMDDWEKEEIYLAIKNKEIVVSDCFESLKIIEINKFVNSIKSDYEQIPFNTLDKASIYGWVRYLGMNKTHIYYRLKDFSTKTEKIYSISKIKLKKHFIMEICNEDKSYFYDTDNIRIFEINNDGEIKGILNTVASFNNICRGRGNIEYIDNKNLVLSNNKLNQLEVISLDNNKEYKSITYTGRKHIIKNKIIIY